MGKSMMSENLKKKIKFAIKLIQSASNMAQKHGQPLEVAYSGGKDSDVILELTKMAKVPFRAIYKNTTIDPAGTIKHAQEVGAEILRPKHGFFELVHKMGFPNRFTRFCCGYLKEYHVLDYTIVGIRKDESIKRSKIYKEPEMCRVYSKTKKSRQYFPILEWTAKDVEEFIKERGIKCAPIYYDKDGNFNVECRLGCMCCPLMSKKNRIESFKKNPKMVRAYIRAGKRYLELHKDGKNFKQYNGDVFAWFVRDVFYPDDTQGWNELNNGFIPPPILRFF